MTHWTPAQRADAIGKALAVGADKAAAQTGIPRRTISSWLNRERPAPELDGLIVSSRKQVADRLWEAVDVGTEAVLAGLRDPKARLGDKANALRIVAEQYALLTGGATARTENLNVNAEFGVGGLRDFTEDQKDTLLKFVRDVVNMTDDELRAAAPVILPWIAGAEHLADDYVAGDPEAIRLLTEPEDVSDVG